MKLQEHKSKRCPTCGRLRKRGNMANRRYWLLIHMIADAIRPEGKSFSPEAFHEYFKLRYLGADELKLPNGKIMNRAKSSAELDTEEFGTYMMQVEQWAQEHNIFMEDLA